MIGGAILFAVFVMVLMQSRASSSTGEADPIAEAEVYIAYGRVQQAIEILEEGVKLAPDREDIANKLKELKAQQ